MPCLLLDISPFLIICGTFYAWCSIQFCQLIGGNTIQTFLHVQGKLYYLKIRRKTSVKDSIWSIYVCIYSRNISNLYLSRYIHMIFSSISMYIYIYMWEGPSGLIRTNTYMCCNTWLITTKTNHGPSNKINPIIGPQMRYRNAKTPFLSVHWSFTISSILLSWTLYTVF